MLLAPRFDHPFDPGAHLAEAPADATMIGLFFSDTLASLRGRRPRSTRLRELVDRRYVPFLKYSLRDWLELNVLVAQEAFGDVPLREGLRRVGVSVYETFTSTMVGRAIFGIAGRDLDGAFALGPKGFNTVVSRVGSVRSAKTAERTWLYTFERYPTFIDSYAVGVFEGVLRKFGATGTIRCSKDPLFDGEIEISWR